MCIIIAGAPVIGGWTPQLQASHTFPANRRNISSQSETVVRRDHTDCKVALKQQNQTIYLVHIINL